MISDEDLERHVVEFARCIKQRYPGRRSPFTLEDAALYIRAGERRVRRVLKKLTERGVLVERYHGPRLTWSLLSQD